MKLDVIIDPDAEEQITAVVHSEGSITDALRRLVMEESAFTALTVYSDRDMKRLPLSEAECIFVLDGKCWAVDKNGEKFRVKEKLCELEPHLPSYFIRINKSAVANEKRLERFRATLGGGVDAIFASGHKEYVSRRCFAEIKRRISAK